MNLCTETLCRNPLHGTDCHGLLESDIRLARSLANSGTTLLSLISGLQDAGRDLAHIDAVIDGL